MNDDELIEAVIDSLDNPGFQANNRHKELIRNIWKAAEGEKKDKMREDFKRRLGNLKLK